VLAAGILSLLLAVTIAVPATATERDPGAPDAVAAAVQTTLSADTATTTDTDISPAVGAPAAAEPAAAAKPEAPAQPVARVTAPTPGAKSFAYKLSIALMYSFPPAFRSLMLSIAPRGDTVTL
jgi:hypothetical protein